MTRTSITPLLLVTSLAACGGGAPATPYAGADLARPGGDGGACESWAPPPLWATAADDELLGLAADGAGNVYVAGYAAGRNDQDNYPPSSDSRGVVMKLDPSGREAWRWNLDTADSDTVDSIALAPGGAHLLAAGRTRGALPGFKNSGAADLIAAILDGKTGQPARLWQAGREAPEHPMYVSWPRSDGAFVAGYDDVHAPGGAVKSWEDGFALALDIAPSTGHAVTQRWWLHEGSGGTDFIRAVAAEADGSAVYVGGSVLTGSRAGAFVRKLDGGGKLVWERRISTVGLDAANALAIGPGGELYAAGATMGQLGERSFGDQDVFVMRLDKAKGDTIWVTQAGGPGADWAWAMALDAAGRIHVAGETTGSVVDGVTSQGDFDAMVLSFDNAGGARVGGWQRGTPGDDTARAVTVDACGRVLVGGYASGKLEGAPHAGGRDPFLRSIDILEVRDGY